MALLPRLIVLTSTFPRWADDQQPDFVFALCRRLQEMFRVIVVAPHAEGAADREQMAGIDVVRFRYAPARFERLAYAGGMLANIRSAPWLTLLLPAFLLAQGRILGRLLGEESSPTVVHAHWLFPQGWIAMRTLKRFKVPLLVTAHGSDVMGLQGRFWDSVHRQTLSRAQAVTVVGPELGDRLSAMGRQAILLPLGVDTHYFSEGEEVRSSDLVVYVGRLAKEKGVAHLLKALASLTNDGRSLRLAIVGDGAERLALEQLMASLGITDRVDFIGWQSRVQLRDYYRSATCCVFPSLREGFGLAVVEAMACGAPVIASDLPAFRHVDGGMHAIRFFAPGDDAGLASLLLDTLDSPAARSRLSAQARERALAFSASTAAAAYGEILLGLARREG